MHRYAWGALLLSMTLVLPAGAQISDSPTATPSPGATQSPGTPGGNREEHQERFRAALKQLNLSADQQTRINRILDNSSLHGRERMEAIRAVLTPEQQQQLNELMPHHHHGGPGASGSGS